MGRTKKKVEEVPQKVEVDYIVPEEGGIYKSYSVGVTTYVYLEETYYATSRYASNTNSLLASNSTYIGNLKDFRPRSYDSGNFEVSNHVEIDSRRTGCKYDHWYRVGSVSEDEKTRQAFEKFFKTVPGLVPPTEDPKVEEKSWWDKFFG